MSAGKLINFIIKYAEKSGIKTPKFSFGRQGYGSKFSWALYVDTGNKTIDGFNENFVKLIILPEEYKHINNEFKILQRIYDDFSNIKNINCSNLEECLRATVDYIELNKKELFSVQISNNLVKKKDIFSLTKTIKEPLITKIIQLLLIKAGADMNKSWEVAIEYKYRGILFTSHPTIIIHYKPGKIPSVWSSISYIIRNAWVNEYYIKKYKMYNAFIGALKEAGLEQVSQQEFDNVISDVCKKPYSVGMDDLEWL